MRAACLRVTDWAIGTVVSCLNATHGNRGRGQPAASHIRAQLTRAFMTAAGNPQTMPPPTSATATAGPAGRKPVSGTEVFDIR